MLITITGVPISVNHCYFTNRQGQRILTLDARGYINTVGWATRVAWLEAGQPDFEGDVVLEFRYFFPDKLRRDTNNMLKLICDGITAALGIDDSRFLCRDMERSVDRENPRVEVEIQPFRKYRKGEGVEP